MKELRPSCARFACELETAAPLAAALEAGRMVPIQHSPSFVDGCGGKSVLEPMWPVAKELITRGFAVPLSDIAEAIRTVAERNRVIAEGAGGCPVAVAMFHPD